MRFLLDASLPRSAGDAVRALGHEVLDVREIGLGSATDEVIAKRALNDSLVLLTRDFDFADVRNYPPEKYAGIVVVDLPNQANAAQIARTLEAFIANADWLPLLTGRLAIVEAARVRFRPAPDWPKWSQPADTGWRRPPGPNSRSRFPGSRVYTPSAYLP